MNSLIKTTGFIAFISMIFLNAFVDLGHKIIIQNTVFKIYDGSMQVILTAIINGLILLPFVLLFTPSGFLADRFKKPKIMQWAAVLAVVISLIITASYSLGWFKLAFAMTFLLAAQSAFYSPAKYGYIREIAGKNHLTIANGVVQSVTIIAILLGMFVFSILFENALENHQFSSEADIIRIISPLGWLLVAGSLIELYFALRLPNIEHSTNQEAFDWKEYRTGKSLFHNFKLLRFDPIIWLSIVGLSVFWGVSQVVLATFPAFAKEVLSINNTVVIQGLLACSGIGIVAGSLLAGKISDRYIESGLIPLGALGMVVTLFFLPQLTSTSLFAIDILAFGFFGGLFIVPLNALIQFHAKAHQLGTILAGNNWIQNVVMLTFLVLTVLFSLFDVSSQILLNSLTLVTLVGAAYTVWKLPQSLVRYILGIVFASKYRINVQGFDHMPSQGPVLLLGNHISWLDWAMIQIASPRPVLFVMDKSIYQKWYLTWFLDLFGVIPISGSNSKGSLAIINQRLKQGEVVCLFPEGSISRNGQLAEFKQGFERCVEEVDGIILPFYLRGLWGSRFSRSSTKMQLLRQSHLRRDIIVAFGEPMPINTQTSAVKSAVFDLSIDTWNSYTQSLPSLAHAWIDRAKQNGKAICLTDIQSTLSLSRRKALTIALLFSRRFKKQSPEQNIGLLLPTSTAGILANMGAFISGKTVVNLNFTANANSLLSAINKAEIKTIYTSRRFIKKLYGKGIDLEVLFQQASPVYLEDIQENIKKPEQILVLLASYCLPTLLLIHLFGKAVDIHSSATILFSSGSEGTPKGVVLSHQNIMGNIKQVSDVLNIQDEDVIVASLPLFHAFGLTVTGLLPLIEGLPAICHPDPTDVLNIAKGISRHQATIFCGTSTFFRLFSRNKRIHPLMLDSLRIVVAGAERLNPEIRDSFSLKFGKTIYEGYGTTETTPVATVNIPDRIASNDWKVQVGNKNGTVGLPLPGSSVRIVDPATMENLTVGEDGLILIGGTQVMQGYLNDPDKTAEVIIKIDGHRWYKTGDKGHLDNDGFLSIVDRYSRFAKIGGEMISLSAIEASINKLLPQNIEILTTTMPDDKKGEKVVLLYAGTIEDVSLKRCITDSDLNSLMMPSLLIQVDAIPKLGSGKSDFNTAKKIALAQINATNS
jgi:acyl-[acyl-carrier-protein]-phospholipid O-acyltransferase/long-chain-fatty-acid--[acyl-carrier-protein] ligase